MTTWRELKQHSRVKPHKTSLEEINDLFSLVERDLKDAAIEGVSSDRRFATAYNAVLQLCKIVIAVEGYRVSGSAHHQTSFEAASIALGSKARNLMDYFDTCRRKRNVLDYEKAKIVTETETSELLEKARQFRDLVRTRMSQRS